MSRPTSGAQLVDLGFMFGRDSTESFRISRRTAMFIELAPFALLLGFSIFIALPATQDAAVNLLRENCPVELLTFGCALAGGIIGIRLALRAWNRSAGAVTWGFYFIFSLGLIFLAGEEVAWGQDFVWYQTPEFWRRHNSQGQLTLHNLQGWHGHNHLLRFAFGFGGLAGIFLARHDVLEPIAPPKILRFWFALILLKSLVDIYVKNVPVDEMAFYVVNKVSEVVEMMVAMAGLLHVWLNGRRPISRRVSRVLRK